MHLPNKSSFPSYLGMGADDIAYMTMSKKSSAAQAMQFDHLVIFVEDLDGAINDFSALGFNVTRGGSHGLTENALIIFANQSYIELLALKPFYANPLMAIANRLGILQWQSERKKSLYCRLLRWVNGDVGPVDWCVRVTNLAASLERWKEGGLDILNSETFARERTDGEIVRWHLGGVKNHNLPILLQDITALDQRVPLVDAMHANQGAELREVQFAVEDTGVACDMANRFLGVESGADNPLMVGDVKISFAEQSVQCKLCLSIVYPGKQVKQLDIASSYGLSIKLVPA